MFDYWLKRRHQALEGSRSAETAELRELYLWVADQCMSLEDWCSAPRMGDPEPFPKTAIGRLEPHPRPHQGQGSA